MKNYRDRELKKPIKASGPSLSIERTLAQPPLPEAEGLGFIDRALRRQTLETQRRMVRWAMDKVGMQREPAADVPAPGVGWVEITTHGDRAEGRRVYQRVGDDE